MTPKFLSDTRVEGRERQPSRTRRETGPQELG